MSFLWLSPLRLAKVDFRLVHSGVKTLHRFFQLKFYPIGSHSFRLFRHLETESQGQSTRRSSATMADRRKCQFLGLAECDVGYVHMLHYNCTRDVICELSGDIMNFNLGYFIIYVRPF